MYKGNTEKADMGNAETAKNEVQNENRCREVSGMQFEAEKQEEDAVQNENGKQNEITVLSADNRGIGVVEIILILVILIGLVLLFQTQIKGIVTNALNDISKGAGKIGI